MDNFIRNNNYTIRHWINYNHTNFEVIAMTERKIAPLMVREFPERAIKELIKKHPLRNMGYWAEWVGPFRTDLKSLWEGQEPREGDNPPAGGLKQEKPEGTCKGCGGVGKGYWKNIPASDKPIFFATPNGAFDCPDCDGTGECQHNDVKHIGGCLYCPDCRQYINDRRSGEERREGHGRRRHDGLPQGQEARRTLPDRRKA